MKRANVVKAYIPQYPDPITFRKGERVQVRQEDSEYVGWYWCVDMRGREGWVHKAYLSDLKGIATAVMDFTAKEAAVRPGQTVAVLYGVDGWTCVDTGDGVPGWVPETCLKTSD